MKVVITEINKPDTKAGELWYEEKDVGENVRRITFDLEKKADADILAWLGNQKDRREALRQLIRDRIVLEAGTGHP